MPYFDKRAAALGAVDASMAEFKTDCAARFQSGSMLADLDAPRLTALAERLALNISDWEQATGSMDLARRDSLNASQAARLVIESVFDIALTPSAVRVLDAAVNLALQSR